MIRARSLMFLAAVLVATPTLHAQTKAQSKTTTPRKIQPPVQMEPTNTPLVFEPNLGQFSPSVQWVARGSGFTLAIESDGATIETRQRSGEVQNTMGKNLAPSTGAKPKMTIPGPTARKVSTVKMHLAGANALKMEGASPTGGSSNYFIGKDSKQWHTGVPHYAQAKASGVYNGIDMVFHGNQSALEYDFVVAPGADPKQIQLKFDGAANLHKDQASGELVMTTASGKEMRHGQPKIYQQNGNKKAGVKGGYEVQSDGTVKFAVGEYDRTKPLVIDPTVSFVTFLYGSDLDEAGAVAVDGVGNIYVTGHSESSDFPLVSSFQAHDSGDDAFVTKLDPNGNILFSTFLGGGDTDSGQAIAVDSSGVYITGLTKSDDFPLKQAIQGIRNGNPSAFVTKLSLLGNSLVYSTFLGGSNGQQGTAIAVDLSQCAYVAGFTTSDDFALKNQFQESNERGSFDVRGFITKFSPSGGALEYSTYLQDSTFTEIGAIALDKNLSAYVTGETCGNDFPFAGYDSQGFPGNCTGFVTKMAPAGDSVLYSTYLGNQTTGGYGIAVDVSGNAYVAGDLEGGDTKTTQVFAMKLNAAGKLIYTKLLNGDNGSSEAFGIAVDSEGDAYIVGDTTSDKFPGAQKLTPNPSAGFITELDNNGNGPIYSQLFGAKVLGVARFIEAGHCWRRASKYVNLYSRVPFHRRTERQQSGRIRSEVDPVVRGGEPALDQQYVS